MPVVAVVYAQSVPDVRADAGASPVAPPAMHSAEQAQSHQSPCLFPAGDASTMLVLHAGAQVYSHYLAGADYRRQVVHRYRSRLFPQEIHRQNSSISLPCSLHIAFSYSIIFLFALLVPDGANGPMHNWNRDAKKTTATSRAL